jgi:hypothetical protein
MAESSRGQHFGCSGGTGAEIGVFGMLSSTLLGIQLMMSISSTSNDNNNNNNNDNVGKEYICIVIRTDRTRRGRETFSPYQISADQ